MNPVIVVGAGPVGLALSLSLARAGVPVVVVEQETEEEPARLARSVVLGSDTVDHLTRLGCGPAMAAAGCRWTALRTLRRTRLMERVPFDDSLPSPLHVPQHALTSALRSALAQEPAARLVTGARAARLDQDASGVRLTTQGATPGNPAEWHGSYLVGCDGARSLVRKLLGVRFPGRTAVERHAVAALRCELPWPGEAVLHRFPRRRDAAARDTEVTARPLPDGVWRLDWLLPPGRDLVTPQALLTRVREALADWAAEAAHDRHDRSSAATTEVPYELLDTGVHTVHHRLALAWRRERVFLAGDAAHLLGALGTHGLDEGFRDAENLAWKLAWCWHHGPDEALLDSYQHERRGSVAARLRAADQVLPLLRDGVQGAGLRRLLPKAGTGPLALLADGHLGRGPAGGTPQYTGSPLTPEGGPGGRRGGGQRTPVPAACATPPGALTTDVPVTAPDGSRVRLHDRLGHRLLVVLVAPGTAVWDQRHWMSAGVMPQLNAVVADLAVPAEVLVAEAYPGTVAHTVLVVRPDGRLVCAVDGVNSAQLRDAAGLVWRGVTGAEGTRALEAGPGGLSALPAGAARGPSSRPRPPEGHGE
ncbi:FAD-dependent monooxygenase [Streptomyces sp. NPDC059740]|uniref:FAD-dependent monooxygenase n=1 Tax=Streptomyces sp. NPDC059740 TaxID=3346926 RepID=UPI003660F3E6